MNPQHTVLACDIGPCTHTVIRPERLSCSDTAPAPGVAINCAVRGVRASEACGKHHRAGCSMVRAVRASKASDAIPGGRLTLFPRPRRASRSTAA